MHNISPVALPVTKQEGAGDLPQRRGGRRTKRDGSLQPGKSSTSANGVTMRALMQVFPLNIINIPRQAAKYYAHDSNKMKVK